MFEGLGFRVYGWGQAWGMGCGVEGLGFRVDRVEGVRFMVQV